MKIILDCWPRRSAEPRETNCVLSVQHVNMLLRVLVSMNDILCTGDAIRCVTTATALVKAVFPPTPSPPKTLQYHYNRQCD